MAKKKTASKNSNAGKSSKKPAQTNWMHTNLFRLCFLICIVVACILALGKLGLVGSILFNLMEYVIGVLTYPVLIAIMGLCFWQMAGKENKRIRRRYIFAALCFLLAFSIMTGFMKISPANPWQQLKDTFIATFDILLGHVDTNCGLLGAMSAGLSISLFDRFGTSIIVFMFLVLGFVLVFYDWYVSQETKPRLTLKPKVLEKEEYTNKIDSLINEIEPEEKTQSFIDVDDFELKEKNESVIPGEEKKKKRKKLKEQTFITLHEEEKKLEEEIKKVVKPEKEAEPIATNYALPTLSVLQDVKKFSRNSSNSLTAKKQGQRLLKILEEFNIRANLIQIHIGPSVTKFEIKPELGVRVSRISGLQDDIKMALSATDIRIEAPIPGKNAVGIEIPNVDKMPVQMKDLMLSIPKDQKNKALLFCLGKDLMGECVYGQLDRMPHLLIAGATGSGKSVCVNSIICSLLMRADPDEIKLVLIDPKKVEFTPYNDIPHLLAPVITDGDLANKALKVVVEMMDHRYDLFGICGVRNITAYNTYQKNHPEEKIPHLPRIVVVIDELADLMLVSAKEVEQSIQRITQLARAAGIYLVVATQRPSVDVITGVIKSNIPSRIAFAVASSVDSRTILDQSGAERLLGNGDMLYLPNGETVPKRIQGVFIQDEEVNQICEWVKQEAKPKYDDAFIQLQDLQNQGGQVAQDCADPLYPEVKRFVIATQKASTSLIQRKFSVGYARAARLIDVLEENNIIGPARGSKPREILVENSYEEID